MIMAVRCMSIGGRAWPAWYAAPRYALRCSPVATYSGARDASDEDEWVRVRREQRYLLAPTPMSMARSQTRLPVDGLATLGGRLVHVASRPGSGPPIVLLGGCGVPSYDWDLVADLLLDLALVLLDRPGLLGSPWPGELPQLASEVRTLESLLESIRTPSVGRASSAHESANETVGRTIVVAHSMAGFHAEALVRQRPDLVMGLVLADGSVELRPSRPRPRRSWLRFARLVRRAMVVPALRPPSSFVQRLLVAAQSHRRVTAPVSSLTRQTFRDPESRNVCLVNELTGAVTLRWLCAATNNRCTNEEGGRSAGTTMARRTSRANRSQLRRGLGRDGLNSTLPSASTSPMTRSGRCRTRASAWKPAIE